MFPPPYVHEKMRARKDVLFSPPQYVYSFTAFFVRGKKVLGCDAMHHRPFSWPTIDTWNEGPVWSVPYLAPHGLTERLAVIPALVMWGAGGTVEEHPKRNQSSEADRRVGPPHRITVFPMRPCQPARGARPLVRGGNTSAGGGGRARLRTLLEWMLCIFFVFSFFSLFSRP